MHVVPYFAEAISSTPIHILRASTALFQGGSPSSIQPLPATRQARFTADRIKAVRFIGSKRYPRPIMCLNRNAVIFIITCVDVVDMVHLDIPGSPNNIAFFNYRLTGEETNVFSDAVDEAMLRQGLRDSDFLSDLQFSQQLGERLTDDAIL